MYFPLFSHHYHPISILHPSLSVKLFSTIMSLVKWFKGGKNRVSSLPSTPSNSSRRRGKKLIEAEAQEQEETTKLKQQHGAIVKRTMDEETFASGMPSDKPSLADKLDSHKSGTLFKYAVIANEPSTERKDMLARIRSFKPKTKVTSHTLNDIPAIRLTGDFSEIFLSQIINPKQHAQEGDYLLVDCILVHFVPLDSFANDKSIVTIQVNDFRKVTQTVVRTAKVDNTMGYNILFFLDYCIEMKDAPKLTLSFACGTKEFQEDVAWGAVKVVAQLQILTFPKRMPLIGTMGVMLLADTDLDDFECDPREIDMVLTPNVLQRLREAHKRGEIENRTIAQTDKKEMMTAKTMLGESYEAEEVSSVVQRMREVALLKERQENAKMRNKDKLKRIQEETVPAEEEDIKQTEENEQDYDEMVEKEDLRPEDSISTTGTNAVSDVGDSESAIQKALRISKPAKSTRFID